MGLAYMVAERIRLLFMDLAGVLRGTEIPFSKNKGLYKTMFDASSVYGFEEIENSDLELRVPGERLRELPWNNSWLAGIASIHYPGGRRYSKDPRLVAENTEEYLGSKGFSAKMGVEMEFFLFNTVSVSVKIDRQELAIGSKELQGGSTLIPPKKGYHLVEPVDNVALVRKRIIDAVERIGYKISKSHHEVATAGQVEITSNSYNIVDLCDFTTWFKYIARTVAELNNYTAVFIPKPLLGDNGSGMHIHISLWRDGRNLFYDTSDKYLLSQTARYFIGGLLEHGRSLSALVSPTVNSYRRLVPGFEAPTILAWGVGNRSTAVRVPRVVDEKLFRIEYRPPDPLANPYLAIPALVMAGLDGIRKKIDPGEPLEKNAYKLSRRELDRRGYKHLPRSLEEALDELESDNEYLKTVFNRETIESYIEVKRRESRELQAIPSPSEYMNYLYW